MFHSPLRASNPARAEVSGLLGTLARTSTRPRYAFMMLCLIAEVADEKGSAGPWVRTEEGHVPLREWLCDALSQMAERDAKRRALVERVEAELAGSGRLPADPQQARWVIEEEVLNRVRQSGKTNVSRAVSELVQAGLLRRYYQGYCVDHENRGARRQAVYSLTGKALMLLGRAPLRAPAMFAQGELPL